MIIDEEVLNSLFQFIYSCEFANRNRKVNLFRFNRRRNILEGDVDVILKWNRYAQYVESVKC